MALSNLKVYSEYAYSMRTELLNDVIALFNGATKGGIRLSNGANQGDYSRSTFWKKGTTTRRRNAYATTAIGTTGLQMGEQVGVKVAAGTPEFRYTVADMLWIQQNAKAEARAFGEQLAKDAFADMLRVGIGSMCAATANQPEVYNNVSAAVAPADLVTYANLVDTVAKLGDANGRIKAWVMNSKPFFDLLKTNLTNSSQLFNWENVVVIQDPQGRPLIVTDLSPLVITGAPNNYYTLGLTDGAIQVEQNNDYHANEVEVNGSEQIVTSFQAEWSFNAQLEGYSWDTVSGGPSPTDAALFTAANWDRIATDKKDLGAVLLRSK